MDISRWFLLVRRHIGINIQIHLIKILEEVMGTPSNNYPTVKWSPTPPTNTNLTIICPWPFALPSSSSPSPSPYNPPSGKARSRVSVVVVVRIMGRTIPPHSQLRRLRRRMRCWILIIWYLSNSDKPNPSNPSNFSNYRQKSSEKNLKKSKKILLDTYMLVKK